MKEEMSAVERESGRSASMDGDLKKHVMERGGSLTVAIGPILIG